MINDLIGLRHELTAKFFPGCKTIDCFGLFIETRRRLGLHDFADDFAWVYQEMENQALPLKKIAAQMKMIARRTDCPIEGDLAVLPSKETSIGLGVVVNGGILTITDKGPSFWCPLIQEAKFWTPINSLALN